MTNIAIEIAVQSFTNQSPYKARLANKMLDQLSGDHAAPTMIDAIWQATMLNAKFNQQEEENCKAVGALHKPEIYDISFHGFIQQIMNKVCWNARQAANARIEQDAEEAESSGGNGTDKTAEVTENTGLTLSSIADIKDQVDDIYMKLSCVSAEIADKRQLDAEPLYMFAPSERLESGDWVVTHKLDDWDDTFATLNNIVVELNDRPKVDESDIYAPRKYA